MAAEIRASLHIRGLLPPDGIDLVSSIGKGSFGSVHKATQSGQELAVKMVPRYRKGKGADDLNIHNEIIAMQKLKGCLNIIGLQGTYMDVENNVWICMELCVGSLTVLTNKPQMPETTVLHIMQSILTGLDYMHTKGFVHRDIKGANCLLTDTGIVKLADFGLTVRCANSTGQLRSVVGTTLWRAPELLKCCDENGIGYGTVCDVWSAAVLLCEFECSEYVAGAKNKFTPSRVLKHNGFKSRKLLHNLLTKMLVIDPNARPSARELLELESFQSLVDTKRIRSYLVAVATLPDNGRGSGTAPDWSKMNYPMVESTHNNHNQSNDQQRALPSIQPNNQPISRAQTPPHSVGADQRADRSNGQCNGKSGHDERDTGELMADADETNAQQSAGDVRCAEEVVHAIAPNDGL